MFMCLMTQSYLSFIQSVALKRLFAGRLPGVFLKPVPFERAPAVEQIENSGSPANRKAI